MATTKFLFMNTGEGSDNGHHWDDCKRYGYMLAGGTVEHIRQVRTLAPGDRLFAYLSRHGYVGAGVVTSAAVSMLEFKPAGQGRRLMDLPVVGPINADRMADPARCDWCVSARWVCAVGREEAIFKHRFRRSTIERIRQPDLVVGLLQAFEISEADF